MANTISLIARQESISLRTGWWIHQGAMLAELSSPRGTANATASTVPQTAICTVMSISFT